MEEIKEIISLRRMRGPGLERLKAAPRVLIESDNGFWRENAQGYCYRQNAAIYTGADAYNRTRHCGPEKQVRYHVLRKAISASTASPSEQPARPREHQKSPIQSNGSSQTEGEGS